MVAWVAATQLSRQAGKQEIEAVEAAEAAKAAQTSMAAFAHSCLHACACASVPVCLCACVPLYPCAHVPVLKSTYIDLNQSSFFVKQGLTFEGLRPSLLPKKSLRCHIMYSSNIERFKQTILIAPVPIRTLFSHQHHASVRVRLDQDLVPQG